jgi:lipoprotein-anchoring transpeptidase ErfK/SrfK
MTSSNTVLTATLLALALGLAGTASSSAAQNQGYPGTALGDTAGSTRRDPTSTDYSFRNRKDSLDWVRWKKVADKSKGFRIIVSLQERRVTVLDGEDTLLTAPAAVASGQTLTYKGYSKTFDMPRGIRTVRGKDADPIWTPPKWLYYEAAAELGLKVREIPAKGLKMPDGRRLYVNSDNEIGVITANGPEKFSDRNLHLIFDDYLYIPPVGTLNRKVNGTLGKFKLDMGEGFLLHGTPLQNSIGLAATHGCVRLRDEDIEWLYHNIPIGTKVYVY